MNRNRRILLIGSLAVAALVLAFTLRGDSAEEKEVTAEVVRGDFEVNVFTTGELEAMNSVRINGPEGIRSVGIWQVKIADMVAEGTVVKKGDYIAALDKTEVANKMKDAENDLLKAESQYRQTQLDTALTLRQARDEGLNLHFAVKEKEIVLEQSQYEPPATIRQAELDLERSKRAYEQAQTNYQLKRNQAQAKMQEAAATFSLARSKHERLVELLGQFTITAPEAGMVIYQREWNGKKRTVGSTIGAWDPTVATLPDLTTMISKTYVNEVDIRKIEKDQKVDISLDAFPEKRLTGQVSSVANVGEQSPKSDAKVFEVIITVNERDTSLRPAMTTGNKIRVDRLENQLYIPLEALHNQGDSLSFVYVKNGLSSIRKELVTGASNDNFIVVLNGLVEGETLYLSTPDDPDKIPLERLSSRTQVANR